MPNNNVVDEFLNQINGDEPTFEKEQNPFAKLEVQQEEVIEEEEKVEEKPLPFNKDPKIQKFIQKEVERLTKDLSPKEAKEFKAEHESDLVSAFATIIGNDTPEKVTALNMLKKTVDDLKTEARSAKDMLEAERQADALAEKELADGFESIEENFNVDLSGNKKLRSDFIQFVERVAPKDSEGNIREYPDFQETFKLFQEVNKKSNTRAKELASRSMTRSSEASASQVPTDTSWRGVEKFFSTLKG